MKWFFLLQEILLMISVASAAQELVTINQITLINDSPAGLKFCWTDNAVTYEKAELTVLQNPSGVTQTPITGALEGVNCASFLNDPTLTVNPADRLAFALRLFKTAVNTKPAPDAEGFVTMVWPDVNECQSAYSISVTNTIFRLGCDAEIKDSDHTLLIDDNPTACSITSDAVSVNYCFLEVAPASSNNFQICQFTDASVNEDDTVLDICAAPIPITIFSGPASDVTSLQLDYTEKMTSATVTQVTETTTFDIVNYWEGLGGTKYSKVCPTAVESPLQCSTEGYTPGRKEVNVLLVGYDSSDPAVIRESGIQTIQDLNLAGVFVLDQTIELRWDLPGASDGIFRAHIANCIGGGSPTFTDADVLCSATATMCYAYFINVPAGSTSCDTTIDIIVSQGEEPKGLNIIKTSVPKPSLSRYQNELQIHTAQVTWHRAAAEAQANVCFNHKSNATDTDFSRYEFVMINFKGQWLKHKLMSQDTAGDLCFSTFSVNTEVFDVSEGATLIVTQRALDGFTVLAGGEAHISFNKDL